jgi:hypothetical protein
LACFDVAAANEDVDERTEARRRTEGAKPTKKKVDRRGDVDEDEGAVGDKESACTPYDTAGARKASLEAGRSSKLAKYRRQRKNDTAKEKRK